MHIMKKIFLSLSILFIISDLSFAQNEFAPVGAEWHHNMSFGVFHSKVTKDTVIDGISCRVIETKPIVKNPAQSPTIWSKYKFFVYNNADTVFIYNTIFNRFTPLYVFNVNEGDTLYLPAIQPPDPYSFIAINGAGYVDSNFCTIIDSVRMVNYDNQQLKTIFSHSWDRNDNSQFPQYSLGTYAERIGGLTTGFLPACENCPGLLADNLQGIGSFRCYSDNQSPPFAVKLVDTCDNGVIVGIGSIGFMGNSISVYPNPSLGKIRVAFSNSFDTNGNWFVTDILGRRMFNGIIHKNSVGFNIDLSRNPIGIYLLKLNDENGHSKVVKIVLKK